MAEGFKTQRITLATRRRQSMRKLLGGPKVPHAAYMIHNQCGLFLRSWRRQAHTGLGKYSTTVTNTAHSSRGAPYAVYLETGTSKMIPRPILQYVARKVAAEHKRIYSRLYRQLVR